MIMTAACGILQWSSFSLHTKGDVLKLILHHFRTANEMVNKEFQRT